MHQECQLRELRLYLAIAGSLLKKRGHFIGFSLYTVITFQSLLGRETLRMTLFFNLLLNKKSYICHSDCVFRLMITRNLESGLVSARLIKKEKLERLSAAVALL